MKKIELTPLTNQYDGEDIRRRCLIKRINDGELEYQTELWFEFDKSITPPKDDDCDSYLLATFMDAMREGRDIIVHGSVSHGLLSNLIEYQSVWNKWLPKIYSISNIIVDSVRHDEIKVSGAICAFSGGVDAAFSVWRHSQRTCGYRSQKINLCAIVHGFDIPLSEISAFENAKNRGQETLDDINVKLFSIRTNYREISTLNWEHACGSALVSALTNFKNIAGTCIVGSSDSYAHLPIPWGSSPITDHLLSSGEFIVLHDGSSHSRTEKVRDISDWKVAVNNLRVCWEGDLKDENCGICEKCVRTKLNFLAAGNKIPICFPDHEGDVDVALARILKRGQQIDGWQEICDFAEINKVNGTWVSIIKSAAKKRNSLIRRIFPAGSRRKKIAIKMRYFLANRL